MFLFFKYDAVSRIKNKTKEWFGFNTIWYRTVEGFLALASAELLANANSSIIWVLTHLASIPYYCWTYRIPLFSKLFMENGQRKPQTLGHGIALDWKHSDTRTNDKPTLAFSKRSLDRGRSFAVAILVAMFSTSSRICVKETTPNLPDRPAAHVFLIFTVAPKIGCISNVSVKSNNL